jgi:hypothetical protein
MPQPTHISALGVPPADTLPDDLKVIWAKCQEKLGFVPNVFQSLSLKPQRLRDFMQLGEMLALNYRVATLDPRMRGMLDFAWKLTEKPWEVVQADRDTLHALGLDNEDIFDLAQVIGLFNLSNRMAIAADMMPNNEYHVAGRS